MIERAGRFGVVLAAFVMLAGCGESASDGDPSTAGAGGGAGSATGGAGGSAGSGTGGTAGERAGAGGSSSGAGGSGAAGGAPDQSTAEYRACAEYTEARCQRSSECGSVNASSCMVSGLPLCPDQQFGPGSNNTPEHILGCADAWREAPCSVFQTFTPVCVYPPGEFENGEPCTSSAQCQSGSCSGSSTFCGVCRRVLEPDESCADSDGACPAGSSCNGGTCESLGGTAFPPGSPCEPQYVSCHNDDVCRADDSGETTCQLPLDAGAACSGANARECQAYHYCDPVTLVCTAGPPAGMPCGDSSIGACDSESLCDRRETPPACVPRVGLGATCFDLPDITDVQGNCQDGLYCVCDAGEDCTDGMCQKRALEGEACGDATTFCVGGTECRAGKCEVSGLQGFYADACML